MESVWQHVKASLICCNFFLNKKLSPRLTGHAGDYSCLSSSCMDFTLGTWPLHSEEVDQTLTRNDFFIWLKPRQHNNLVYQTLKKKSEWVLLLSEKQTQNIKCRVLYLVVQKGLWGHYWVFWFFFLTQIHLKQDVLHLFFVIRPGDMIVAEGGLQLLCRHRVVSLTKCLQMIRKHLIFLKIRMHMFVTLHSV